MATTGNSLIRGAGSFNISSALGIFAMYVPSFPETGSVTSVKFNIEDTGGAGDTFQAAVYSGNTRLGLSTARTDISTEGTYEFTFGTPVDVTAAQPYYFAIGSNSAAGATIGIASTTLNYNKYYSNGSTGVPPPDPNSGGWGSTTDFICCEVTYSTGPAIVRPKFVAHRRRRNAA